MTPNAKTVVMTDAVHPDGMAILEARTDVKLVRGWELPKEGLEAAFAEANAIGTRTYNLPAATLSRAKGLVVVAKHGVGCDNIAVDHMTSRRLPVAITAEANKVSVAEHAFALMMALAKDLDGYDAATRGDRWRYRLSLNAFELAGRTLLIVGFGRIGREVARRARAFDMRVVVADIAMDRALAARLGCEVVDDWRGVLGEADVVTLHVPKTTLTTGMIGAGEIERMKTGAIFINCARGGLVDEPALAAALVVGRLRGAGLDVFEVEPVEKSNPLLAAPNVIVSPHSAGSTAESGRRMGVETAENILAALEGRLPVANIFNRDALGL